MARHGAALDRFLLPLVLASAVPGVTIPAPARWAVERHGVTIALVILVAAVGLGLPVTALTQGRARSTRIAVVVLVPVVVLPVLAWAAKPPRGSWTVARWGSVRGRRPHRGGRRCPGRPRRR